MARYRVAYAISDAIEFLATLHGGAACLKALTNQHKAERGLVYLDLHSIRQLKTAWSALLKGTRGFGSGPPFLVQEQLPLDMELILGARRDPVFGPVVMLGIGGSATEAVGLYSLRLLPLSPQSVRGMIQELAISMDLASRNAIVRTILNFSRLFEERTEFGEVDLNPVLVHHGYARLVDLRIVRAQGSIVDKGDIPLDMAWISRLFSPRVVAVIGASRDQNKAGGRVLRYLRSLAPEVKVYPVNPRGGELEGIQALTDVRQLPYGVDVAVIAIAGSSVLANMRALSDRGVGAAIIFASGFAESGNLVGELAVRDLARSEGIRICGVNTMGLVGDAPLTFTQALELPRVMGGVSYLTQSGALGGSLLARSWAQGLGTARFICVGNQTDLDFGDYLLALANDSATSTIGVFFEGVRDGRKLRLGLSTVAKARKGLAVLRAGESRIGSLSALSHTGTMATADRIYDEVFRESGVPIADDLNELVAMCQALEWQPRARGPRVAVISTSGGACSLVADHLTKLGLQIPELEPAVQRRLRKILPSFAPTRNPLDTTGQIVWEPKLLRRVADVVLTSDRVDLLLFAISTLLGDTAEVIAADLSSLSVGSRLPIVVGWSLPESVVSGPLLTMRQGHIPVFDSFRLACVAARALVDTTH